MHACIDGWLDGCKAERTSGVVKPLRFVSMYCIHIESLQSLQNESRQTARPSSGELTDFRSPSSGDPEERHLMGTEKSEFAILW